MFRRSCWLDCRISQLLRCAGGHLQPQRSLSQFHRPQIPFGSISGTSGPQNAAKGDCFSPPCLLILAVMPTQLCSSSLGYFLFPLYRESIWEAICGRSTCFLKTRPDLGWDPRAGAILVFGKMLTHAPTKQPQAGSWEGGGRHLQLRCLPKLRTDFCHEYHFPEGLWDRRVLEIMSLWISQGRDLPHWGCHNKHGVRCWLRIHRPQNPQCYSARNTLVLRWRQSSTFTEYKDNSGTPILMRFLKTYKKALPS